MKLARRVLLIFRVNDMQHVSEDSMIKKESRLPVQLGMPMTFSLHLPCLHLSILVLSLLSGNTVPNLHRKVLEVRVSFNTELPLGAETSGHPSTVTLTPPCYRCSFTYKHFLFIVSNYDRLARENRDNCLPRCFDHALLADRLSFFLGSARVVEYKRENYAYYRDNFGIMAGRH